VIPLYGFLQGDTLGLLVLADENDTIGDVAAKLKASASVRLAPRDGMQVMCKDRVLDPRITVAGAGLEPLDRIDVVMDETSGETRPT
jgi:hypothetical protein